MQKRVSQIGGDYCFNLINTLIDYKGDVARNSKRNDGQILYSPDFSPNNIRRLILSADGAKIDFHISVDGRLSKVKAFSDMERMNLNKCLLMQDYKPMIWALADRVCSSIEEVIICVKNSTGADLGRELNFEGLLRNRISSNADVRQEIAKRYKRLAYFTIVNCDINTLVKSTEVMACNNSTKLISETEFVKSCGSVTKFKSDWYNFYGHTSAYSLDNAGSPLNEHFKKVKVDIEETKKKLAVDSLKDERLKVTNDKFSKVLQNYSGVYNCIRRLSVIVSTEGICYLANGIEPLVPNTVASSDELKEQYAKLKTKDSCEDFIKNMITTSSSMYLSLATWFFNNLCSIKELYPLTFDLFINQMERRIAVPPNCVNLISQLGVEFKGVSMPDSTSNICCYACLAFITDCGEHNMSKYYLKDTWMKNFEGGTN